jgi:hypothetical protein
MPILFYYDDEGFFADTVTTYGKNYLKDYLTSTGYGDEW